MVFRLPSIVLAALMVSSSALCQQGFVISTTSLPPGSVGQQYGATVVSNGSKGTTWSISGGSLPQGLSIAAGPGASTSITGTPTAGAGGVSNFTVHASDPTGLTATRQLSIAIAEITTTSPLPGALLATSYTTTLTAVDGGGTFAWVAQSPPNGLTLSSTGVLSGKPANTGTFNVQVTATDQKLQVQVTKTLSLTVAPALTITTLSPLQSGFVGTAYSQTIIATGGFLPYVFSGPPGTAAPPPPAPGLLLGSDGTVSGTPTAAGTFQFTVVVTDSQNFSTSQQFQITISPATPLLQVSPLRLSFGAFTGGDSAPPQTISVIATGSGQTSFQISTDAGSANTPAPSWISVKPASGFAPGAITVTANPGGMGAGTYLATLHVTVPKNTSQNPIDVTVTFTIKTGTPKLEVSPTSVNFGARAQTPSTQEQIVVVRNSGGGGPVSFSTTVVGQSSWITSVSPTTGQTAPNSAVLIRIRVNSQGLAVGNFHDILRITSSAGGVDVAISLFVSAQGSILALTSDGVRFGVRQGNGSNRPEVVQVLNLGDLSTPSNLAVDVLSGADWLKVSSALTGSRTFVVSNLTLTAGGDANTLPVGGNYALVRVSDPGAVNSPLYFVAVLDVQPAAAPATADPSPVGLFFAPGSTSQTVNVYTSSATPIAYQTSIATTDGGIWLAASPSSGIASTQNPGSVSVQVNTAGLASGIYTGSVIISLGGTLRAINITLVVPPGTAHAISNSTMNSVAPFPRDNACTPTAVALTETGIVNDFSVPAGWPASLIVQLNDDCGNPITNGSAVASFSNGDQPLTLHGNQNSNVYSATWQPGIVSSSMTVTIRATSGTLTPALGMFVGGINPNASPAPTLIPNGTLHIFFDVPTANALGGGLAPGNVVQVYGTGMSAIAQSPGVVPLVNEFSGTFMLAGGVKLPLYYVSGGLIDAQIPTELTPNRQYSAIVSANGALTLPETVTLVPFQPGMAAFPDGTVIAQHVLDNYSLVTAAHPAKPGEALVIYLAGMGATNPTVASGALTPQALVPANAQPTLTVDEQHADIGYAGLTPGGIGLYQINFTVPPGARSGNLDLIVTQSGMKANSTKLPVGN